MNNDMEKINAEMLAAVKTIKQAILESQYRAAKSVNREQLALYYSIGKFVSENSREGTWGTGAIETISQTLQKELPGCVDSRLRTSKICASFMNNGAFLQIASQWLSKCKRLKTKKLSIQHNFLI